MDSTTIIFIIAGVFLALIIIVAIFLIVYSESLKKKSTLNENKNNVSEINNTSVETKPMSELDKFYADDKNKLVNYDSEQISDSTEITNSDNKISQEPNALDSNNVNNVTTTETIENVKTLNTVIEKVSPSVKQESKPPAPAPKKEVVLNKNNAASTLLPIAASVVSSFIPQNVKNIIPIDSFIPKTDNLAISLPGTPAITISNSRFKCVKPKGQNKYIGVAKNNAGDVQCASFDGRTCIWTKTEAECNASKIIGLKALTCGTQHKQIYGVTGYDKPNHWCSQYKNSL